MDNQINLYSFVRREASICIAQIEKVSILEGPPGQQKVSLQIRIEEPLWGNIGTPLRHYEFLRPISETAQLKFPDPIWGPINLREGTRILLATDSLEKEKTQPLYVDEIAKPDDPVLTIIRTILGEERDEQSQEARFKRYLRYLRSGVTAMELFGAEALSKDGDLQEIDQEGQVAKAFSEVFESNQPAYTRLSIGTWMWQYIYPRTNTLGKAAIINATVKGMEDVEEHVKSFSLDRMTVVDPKDLQKAVVTATHGEIQLLQNRCDSETSPEVRDNIKKVIEALKK